MRSRAMVCLALGIVALAASPAVARDPWYRPVPPGYVDIKGPVVVDPAGEIAVTTTSRTNIVVIMLDDHPELDKRLWRRLPTIRRLFLEQGVRFTRYHGNTPLCCPGRANFLTGLTTDHHGVWKNDAKLLDPRTTIATELRAQGYFTILAGKYLNDHAEDIARRPPGWSRSAWTSNAYYNYYEYVNGARVYHDEDANDYQPDVAFNRALQFMRETPADKPLFAWVTPFVPHRSEDPFRPYWPRHYAPIALRFQDDERCSGLAPWLTAAHKDDNSDRPLQQRDWNENRNGYNLVHTCRALLAVDEGVARITRELRAQGRLQNTLFIITADNGMGWGAHGRYGKNMTYSTQMPLYIRWPAGRGVGPTQDDTYLSNVDLADTLCEVAGCVMGPYASGLTASDGISFLPVILGTGGISREALYTQYGRAQDTWGWRAIRTTPESPLGLWHYAEYGTGERELYDASGGQCWEWAVGDPGDPCELTNLAGSPGHAETEAALHDMLAAAIRTGGAGPRFSGR